MITQDDYVKILFLASYYLITGAAYKMIIEPIEKECIICGNKLMKLTGRAFPLLIN